MTRTRAALVVLDGAVRRLEQGAGEKRETARERFREALRYDPWRRLSAEEHAPKVLELFQQARDAVAAGTPAAERHRRSKAPSSTDIVCRNPPSEGEFTLRARVTLETASGATTLETADTQTISYPAR